ncbi:Rieske (2Fe-2S) protein [Skermania piniformis]|uniref:Rieske 2Fe-2S domain-containing protein n=1 Tax=Skermania pinensis TaxID=39122 RepID=A0ABX8S834_9ACTN|nr:Rieske 2Fe-2S domain-containing protein [Skermania piniformis]QXQ13601.1 Rieske 2Fe-2S domain-containing protein [Skermania piniformis]
MTAVTNGTGVRLGPAADLVPGEGRTYAVGNAQVAVFRMTDGTLRATDAVCPHRGGPLADGQFDLGQVVCPLHQYAFRFADGGCAEAGMDAVRVYRVAEVEENVVVWV